MSVSRDTTTTHVCSDDASFRAWASAIHNAFTAVGLVNTADTGQINLSTVSRPSTNTDGGYEIWRFSDSNQSAWPVFFKVFYGISGSATVPRLYVIVGSGSDGAGTITGTTCVITELNAGTVNAATFAASTPVGAGTIHICYAHNELVIYLHGSNASSTTSTFAFGYVLGRCRDKDGGSVKANSYFLMTLVGSSNGIGCRSHVDPTPAAGTKHTGANGSSGHPPSSGLIFGTETSMIEANGDVNIGVACHSGKRLDGPIVSLLFMRKNDISDQATGTVTIAGITRSYLAMNFSVTAVSIQDSQIGVFGGTSTHSYLLLNE